MARSYDGCETFSHSDIYFDKTLIDPTVAASLLNYKSVIYFSNPANQIARINMTVRWSGDQGETWKGALNIWKGASGYSCLTAIPTTQTNKTFVGLMFEKGLLASYESIAFVRIQV
jgi:sialidase-1